MIGRRSLVATATLPLFAIKRAHAAEFTFRCGHPLPVSHPLHIRAAEACARILAASDGRVAITMRPNSELGPDTDSLRKLRAGEIEMMAAFGLVLSTVVPVASIHAAGFAFKTYAQVWASMDGSLGAYVKRDIAKSGYLPIGRIWDNGFREVTNSLRPIVQPDDLRDLKIRVPVSPLSISMFKAFGAKTTALNFSELYAALQNAVVEGQENSLVLIDSAKLYEVQSYCSLTNHMWDGYWFLANPQIWQTLPRGLQDLVESEFDRSALAQRADMAQQSPGLRGDLAAIGMSINAVDAAGFQRVLNKAGFYSEWREKFGVTAWGLLEGAVGSLT